MIKYDPENSVLDPVKDERLIAGLSAFAEDAGLQGHPHYIWETIYDKGLPDDEVQLIANWLALFDNDIYGLYWTGSQNKIHKRFMVYTGLITRNYVNATFMNMAELVSILRTGEVPKHRILFIPDFDTEGQQWIIDLVHSCLIRRYADRKFTCVYSKKPFQEEDKVSDFVKENYMLAEFDGFDNEGGAA